MPLSKEFNEKLKALGTKLEKMIEDFSKLTVVTKTEANGQQTQRARTEVNFDGDTVILVPTTDGAIDTALLAIHHEAVKSAIEARLKTIQAVVDAATSLAKAI